MKEQNNSEIEKVRGIESANLTLPLTKVFVMSVLSLKQYL